MTRRWDIVVEPESGFSLDVEAGKFTDTPKGTVRVRYRKLGSRGRYETFVVVGGFGKQTPFEVVNAYEKDRQQRSAAAIRARGAR